MADQADTLRRLMEKRDSESGRTPRAPLLLGVCSRGGSATALLQHLALFLEQSQVRVHFTRMDSETELSDEEESSTDLVLADLTHSDRESWSTQVYARATVSDSRAVIFLTPKDLDGTELVDLLRYLHNNQLVRSFYVIVKDVTSSRDARDLFYQFIKGAGAFLSSRVEYWGQFLKDEKFNEAVRNGKNLLDWNYRRDAATASLELLVKRIQIRILKREESEVAEQMRRLKAGNFAPALRFKDEPASQAPRNKEGFWKNLLGEVKA